MGQVIQLAAPVGIGQEIRDRRSRWATEASRHLTMYAGWFWGAEIPSWVVEGWWCFVQGTVHALGPVAEPYETDWRKLWLAYVEGCLSHEPEYCRQLEVKLQGWGVP